MKNALFILVIIFAFSAANGFSQDADLLSRAAVTGTMSEYRQFEKDLSGLADQYKDLYLGMVLHNISETDTSVIDQAVSKLNAVWEQKQSALALAYLGSAITIRAGEAINKGNIVAASADLADGVVKMDKAVTLDSDNDMIRTLRIMNGLSLSEASPLNRYAEVEEDLEYFNMKRASLDKTMLSFYWYCRGRLHLAEEEWDEALSALEQAVRVSPQSGYARLAEDLLWELEE